MAALQSRHLQHAFIPLSFAEPIIAPLYHQAAVVPHAERPAVVQGKLRRVQLSEQTITSHIASSVRPRASQFWAKTAPGGQTSASQGQIQTAAKLSRPFSFGSEAIFWDPQTLWCDAVNGACTSCIKCASKGQSGGPDMDQKACGINSHLLHHRNPSPGTRNAQVSSLNLLKALRVS